MVGKDNVLITITTAANMAGIEQAKAGMLGLNVATGLLTVALGGVFLAGKSAIEITEQQAKAHANLAQAVKVTGGSMAETDAYLKQFIDSNRRYLTTQSEVQDIYGALLRAGIPVTEAQKDLNRATDLAALKGISLAEATDLLIKAEQGRVRGLIDLGVTTGKYTDAQGNLINGTKDVQRFMAELDPKLKDGRKSYTELEQATKSLNITWQQFATKGGAADQLIGAFTDAVEIGDLFLQFLQAMGHDNAVWSAIQDRLIKMASWINDWIIIPFQKLYNLGLSPYDPNSGTVNRSTAQVAADAAASARTGVFGRGGRASGGPVLPGRSYTVGESAMENLTMFPGGGGYVTPTTGGRSGGGQVHIHLEGIYAGDGPSLDILANKIALRLGYATGR